MSVDEPLPPLPPPEQLPAPTVPLPRSGYGKVLKGRGIE